MLLVRIDFVRGFSTSRSGIMVLPLGLKFMEQELKVLNNIKIEVLLVLVLCFSIYISIVYKSFVDEHTINEREMKIAPPLTITTVQHFVPKI